MSKISPISALPIKKVGKQVVAKTKNQKSVVDLAYEEQGFWKANGKFIKQIFPR